MNVSYEKENNAQDWEYTDEFKAELDRRHDYYINGGEMISAVEADKHIRKVLEKIKLNRAV